MQQEPTIPHIPQPNPTDDLDNTPEEQVFTSSRNEGWKSILSTVLLLALAPLIAWTMISFVFQSYEVDGPSMEQTLQNKDRLIVLKVPKTLARIENKDYIPHRHDIIVFSRSDLREFGTNQERQLIKRVIGLPGERVVVRDGSITIFNAEHPEGFNPDADQEYAKNILTTSGAIDLVVPDGQVFVCGDNRSNSLDSRSFGTVKSEDIVGRLVFRLFPVNKAESF